MDYAAPAAQFTEDSLLERGKPFIGQKITVRGVVRRQGLVDPNNCKIYLGHSICCNLGRATRQAESYTPGRTVFIDGFLKRCEEGNILLEPAGGRDPKAPFNPIQ